MLTSSHLGGQMQVSHLRYSLYYFIMFTTISARNPIKSSAIQNLEVNPKTTQAIVKFNNGKEYLYSNVDTDGLFEVVFGDVKSFGKWVNQYCLNDTDVSSFNLA